MAQIEQPEHYKREVIELRCKNVMRDGPHKGQLCGKLLGKFIIHVSTNEKGVVSDKQKVLDLFKSKGINVKAGAEIKCKAQWCKKFDNSLVVIG